MVAKKLTNTETLLATLVDTIGQTNSRLAKLEAERESDLETRIKQMRNDPPALIGTKNGRRVLEVTQPVKKTPVKTAVQPELKLIGVETVEDQNKYPGAVMLKFNNDKRGRFIYGEEWQAVITAIKAGRI
jgi:hypothetical protein